MKTSMATRHCECDMIVLSMAVNMRCFANLRTLAMERWWRIHCRRCHRDREMILKIGKASSWLRAGWIDEGGSWSKHSRARSWSMSTRILTRTATRISFFRKADWPLDRTSMVPRSIYGRDRLLSTTCYSPCRTHRIRPATYYMIAAPIFHARAASLWRPELSIRTMGEKRRQNTHIELTESSRNTVSLPCHHLHHTSDSPYQFRIIPYLFYPPPRLHINHLHPPSTNKYPAPPSGAPAPLHGIHLPTSPSTAATEPAVAPMATR